MDDFQEKLRCFRIKLIRSIRIRFPSFGAGSMGLMLVGFGLYDSIMDIAILQYDQIQHYDAMVIYDEDATDSQEKDLLKFLDGNSEIDHYTRVQLTKMTAPKEKGSVSIYVYVPENTEDPFPGCLWHPHH